MTLQLRPTFSESWYRVAELRAKLRSSAHIFRQFYRGERWYVVRDPAGNQFHRLSDAAYRFVGLLDGRRTVAEAWELVGGQLADDAPTQPEVIQILSQLYSANLLEADISPDATVLLRRHKQLQKRQMQGRLMNVLFPRIPLWDPDRFLKRWMPVMGLLLSKFGAILWMVVVAAGLFILTSRGWDKLFAATSSATDPGNWFFLWVTFVLIKFIHECGHAFACRRFGGEVHEMGIMFLVFVPTPYVDASTAWAFASRWQRMFVGAAGMIFELFVASIMAFVWANTNETSIWNQLAFNAMLIASVTTIIFNANPLLRYDGYYMLSDWLEIPNLQQRSTEYALGLIKRHIFRVKLQQPLPPLGQRAWMLVYAICSSIYRVFVGIAIILFVAFKVPVLGVLMAIGGVVTWLVMPVVKAIPDAGAGTAPQTRQGDRLQRGDCGGDCDPDRPGEVSGAFSDRGRGRTAAAGTVVRDDFGVCQPDLGARWPTGASGRSDPDLSKRRAGDRGPAVAARSGGAGDTTAVQRVGPGTTADRRDRNHGQPAETGRCAAPAG
jgi:putative peptide zinc metalloprotease protein